MLLASSLCATRGDEKTKEEWVEEKKNVLHKHD